MSEVKKNVWFEPLPENMRNSPLAFVVRWHITKENHDKMVDYATGIIGSFGMDMQRMQPDRHFYSRTRHWFKPNEDGKTEEWWFMDEYDSAEAFEAMQKVVMDSFAGPQAGELQAHHEQLLDLMLPDTTLEPILYSEIESARIEFEPFKIRAAALERATALARKK